MTSEDKDAFYIEPISIPPVEEVVGGSSDIGATGESGQTGTGQQSVGTGNVYGVGTSKI